MNIPVEKHECELLSLIHEISEGPTLARAFEIAGKIIAIGAHAAPYRPETLQQCASVNAARVYVETKQRSQ